MAGYYNLERLHERTRAITLFLLLPENMMEMVVICVFRAVIEDPILDH